MRFTKKPGPSLTKTGVLPKPRTHWARRLTVTSAVAGARTTSTSGILCTGLKKCKPATRCARVKPSCSCRTNRDDVLVASSAEGEVRCSSWAKMARFAARSSMAASTTRSTSARPCQLVVPRRADSFCRIACSVSSPRATAL